MGEMEDKLGAILGNPQMMQQIMSLANSFQTQQEQPAPPQKEQQETMPPFDLGMLQKLSGIARQSGIDQREQSLLRALEAYLSTDRIIRLEKAMRAAKMARLASSVLGQGGLQGLIGGKGYV